MRGYRINAFAAPLEAFDAPDPEPEGREVILRVSRCGVCHTDLHEQDGYYDLGGGKRLNFAERGMPPPLVPGHEVLGEVVALGPKAEGVSVGDRRLVYPWIGCGKCDACLAGDSHVCPTPSFLGLARPGGYADHVTVPDASWLIPYGDMPPSQAAILPCSGLTAFSAVSKLRPFGAGDRVVIIGGGGLGLTAVSVMKALDGPPVMVVDLDNAKLAAARELGADAVARGDAEMIAEHVKAFAPGGPSAVIDFVGTDKTAQQGTDWLRKGGRYIVVGIFGGQVTLPLPLVVIRQISVEGSFVGPIRELRELVALVQAGKIAPIPITERPRDAVNETLDDLRAGRVLGRVVLDYEDS